MIIEAPATAGVRELRELYVRYKGLVLGATARLLLDAPAGDLLVEADALLEDCRIARLSCEAPLRAQFGACESAALELREMLGEASKEGVGSARISSVRATHSRLRHEIWKVIPCEYVPCSAGPRTHTSNRSQHG